MTVRNRGDLRLRGEQLLKSIGLIALENNFKELWKTSHVLFDVEGALYTKGFHPASVKSRLKGAQRCLTWLSLMLSQAKKTRLSQRELQRSLKRKRLGAGPKPMRPPFLAECTSRLPKYLLK